MHGGHSYYVKETKGFSLDRVFAHTSILFCTAERRRNVNNPFEGRSKTEMKLLFLSLTFSIPPIQDPIAGVSSRS